MLRLGSSLDPVTGLASLADKSIDHAITDPPYAERVHVGFGSERRGEDNVEARGDIGFAHLTERTRRELARHLNRVVRRWILIFTDDESVFLWKRALERAGAEWACTGAWIKDDAMPRIDGSRPAYGKESICIAHARPHAGRTRWNGGGRVGIYHAKAQESGRWHPTQKPLNLLETLVRDFTDAGETILDPFAGAGTTLAAARKLGRHIDGWELNPDFYRRALRRVESMVEQTDLEDFVRRSAPKPKQIGLDVGPRVRRTG